MSIFSGISAPTRLGGIFGLSCYMLLHSKFRELVPAEGPNKDTPIFMGHGDSDPLVRPQFGLLTAQLLKQEGYKVTLKMYRYVMHIPRRISGLMKKQRIRAFSNAGGD